MKCGVIVFPGSNCDRDCYHVLKSVFRLNTDFVWHKEKSLKGYDLMVLPGGFSYGDYLRPGAIAKFSPVMKTLADYAKSGGKLIGICNGFQILVEAGLLPGALIRNNQQTFVCKPVHIRVENNRTLFTNQCNDQAVLKIPVAHADGSYFADPDTIKLMEDGDQVLFRYCDPEGRLSDLANPNGSVEHIAGVTNENKTILGMMPHPERCAESQLSNTDGQSIFLSLIHSLS